MKDSIKAKGKGGSLQIVFSGVRMGKSVSSQRHQRQGAPSPSRWAGRLWWGLARQLGSDSEGRGAMFSSVIRNG